MTPIQELDQYFADNGLDRIQFHGTEYAWGYRENEPIIALIYGQDPGMAFQTAMSLYWASADYISKPWCLIMDSATVAPPQRGMIGNLATQYNIQIASESELLDTVKTQSKKLIKLLKVYAPDGSLVSL